MTPQRGRLLTLLGLLLATLGIYFLLGAPWAAREGWEFAGPANPWLGLLLLAASSVALYVDAKRRAATERPTIVLYTRADCALCDEARAILGVTAEQAGYDVWEEDVDKDPALVAKWSDHVPVALLDDEILFTLRADAGTLKERLAKGR